MWEAVREESVIFNSISVQLPEGWNDNTDFLTGHEILSANKYIIGVFYNNNYKKLVYLQRTLRPSKIPDLLISGLLWQSQYIAGNLNNKWFASGNWRHLYFKVIFKICLKWQDKSLIYRLILVYKI